MAKFPIEVPVAKGISLVLYPVHFFVAAVIIFSFVVVVSALVP